MPGIRWKRADDGFVESHCGEWQISPQYWGCTRPQYYELHRNPGYRVVGSGSTQKECKEDAERLKKKESLTVDKA